MSHLGQIGGSSKGRKTRSNNDNILFHSLTKIFQFWSDDSEMQIKVETSLFCLRFILKISLTNEALIIPVGIATIPIPIRDTIEAKILPPTVMG